MCRSIIKRSKLEEEKCTVYSVRRKGAPGRVTELDPVLRDLKKGPRKIELSWNNRVVTAGKDPTS